MRQEEKSKKAPNRIGTQHDGAYSISSFTPYLLHFHLERKLSVIGSAKRQGIFTLILTLGMLWAATSEAAQPRPQKVRLDQAIGKGIVRAEFQGMGSSTGDSILLRIANLTASPLEVEIAPGTVLEDPSASCQDMIVERVRGIPKAEYSFQPQDHILLPGKETEEYVLLAYCLNFDRDNPTPKTRFRLKGFGYPEIQKLFAILPQASEAERSIEAIQIAIWVILQDVTWGELQSRLSLTEADIADARSLLQRTGIETSTKNLFQ